MVMMGPAAPLAAAESVPAREHASDASSIPAMRPVMVA